MQLLSNFIRTDFIFNIRSDIGEATFEATYPKYHSSNGLGQFVGANDEQGYDADHHQLGEADIKHGLSALLLGLDRLRDFTAGVWQWSLFIGHQFSFVIVCAQGALKAFNGRA
jgi:hypothetical protein